MSSDFYDIKNAAFFLPNAKEDCIQSIIASTKDYWDMQAHRIIDKYLKENSVILDIGANIGSHTLYWAIEKKAKKIYSFEPFDKIYEILNTNIKLNYLQDKVNIFNYGLSDEECNAEIGRFNKHNIGGTDFVKNETGRFKLKTLDSLKIKEHIDLIKIDVEGAEVEVLKGGIKTIEKNKPILVIESFNKKQELEELIFPLGYDQVDTIRANEDYIYACRE